MEDTLLTFWYQRGTHIIMTTTPGAHGQFIGTLDLTRDERRDAHVVAWEARAMLRAEERASARLPAQWPGARIVDPESRGELLR